MARTASATNLEDPAVMDELLSTNGWQTLVTIARESAGEFSPAAYIQKCLVPISPAPHRPSVPAPSLPASGGEDFPPEIFDDFMEGGHGNAAGTSTNGGTTVCPHCTFENSHSGGDCDVCGLPLG